MLKSIRNCQKSHPAKVRLVGLAITSLAVSMVLTDVCRANVVGADTQNFNPTTSGLDFVTVQSAETLAPGVVNFGIFLNQAYNSLPYFDDTQQGRLTYTDSLLGADINVGVGLLPHLDVGISAPQVLTQDVAGDGYRGQFDEKGNTEIRINAKVNLYGDRTGGVAMVASTNINRISDNPFIGKDAGPTYNLELAAETVISKVALGLNLGERWRQPGTQIAKEIEPIGDQYIASGAISYLFDTIDTKLIGEVFGSLPTDPAANGNDSNRLASSAEALIGVKHDFTTKLAGHFGAGTELFHGQSSPDWRVYAGLNWATGPTFAKPAPSRSEPTKSAPKTDPFAGPLRAREKIVIHDILFEFDSDNLVLGGTDQTLGRLAAYLNQKPVFTRLIIEGHTDSIGSDAYNINLSRRRAQTIRKWLIQRYHLDGAKIVAVGKGERFPIADNGNYQGRQLNRRVEFTIYRNMKK